MKILLTIDDVIALVAWKYNLAESDYREELIAAGMPVNAAKSMPRFPSRFGGARVHVAHPNYGEDGVIYIGCDKPDVDMTREEIIKTWVIRITKESIDSRHNTEWFGYISPEFMLELYNDLVSMNNLKVEAEANFVRGNVQLIFDYKDLEESVSNE